MSKKIICAAIAALTMLSNTAEAGNFGQVPSVPRPVLSQSTTIMHTQNFTRDTRVFTDQNGKVAMAISSLTRNPASPTSSGRPTSSQGTPTAAQGGQASNTSNSSNGSNSQNIFQARQARQGVNCNAILHNLRVC